jgi:lysozyme family protein
MASLQKALKQTLGYEGEYSNDPDDLGGETYYGISRVSHPTWEGWLYIDKKDKPPEELIHKFYKTRFWDQIRGDEISDQDVANNIFDFAVNAGVTRAVKSAQRAANICTLYRGKETILMLDGKYGDMTHKVIAEMGVDAKLFVFYFLAEVTNHYTYIILARFQNAKFAKGWANRTATKMYQLLQRWNT